MLCNCIDISRILSNIQEAGSFYSAFIIAFVKCARKASLCRTLSRYFTAINEWHVLYIIVAKRCLIC